MKKLQEVRKVLEYYSKTPSWDDGYEEWYDDEGSKAKEALTELNTFMERLESEELVEKVARSIASYLACGPKDHREQQVEEHWRSYEGEAKAAINVIKGES